MKIVEAYAHIHNPFGQSMSLEQMAAALLANVEFGARISHRSTAEDPTPEETLAFLQRTVIDRGDWSVTEHSSVSVLATIDRGISHEWVRHRLFSFTQESTRFVNYEKRLGASFIYPQVEGEKAVRCQWCLNGNEVQQGISTSEILPHEWVHRPNQKGEQSVVRCTYDHDWMQAIGEAEKRYKALLAKGWRPQEARSVFPNGLASMILTTGNLRNWRHFFLSRTSKQAHPQIRMVASALLVDFQKLFPVLYDDIEPGQTQKHNYSLSR